MENGRKSVTTQTYRGAKDGFVTAYDLLIFHYAKPRLKISADQNCASYQFPPQYRDDLAPRDWVSLPSRA